MSEQPELAAELDDDGLDIVPRGGVVQPRGFTVAASVGLSYARCEPNARF